MTASSLTRGRNTDKRKKRIMSSSSCSASAKRHQPSIPPIAVFLAGGAGSGKSLLRNALLEELQPLEVQVIDPDELLKDHNPGLDILRTCTRKTRNVQRRPYKNVVQTKLA